MNISLPNNIIVKEQAIDYTINITIPKKFNYEKVQIKFKEELLYTSKNIPVLDVIFYIQKNYIFVCSWKQRKLSTGDIELDLIFLIELDSGVVQFTNHHLRGAKNYLERYFSPIQELFNSNPIEVNKYLNDTSLVKKFFYYKQIHHFGHTIIDTLAGIDESLDICNKKALVCLPTPLFTKDELDQIFNSPTYIDGHDQNKKIILSVFNNNCLLFNVHNTESYSFNFLKNIQNTACESLKKVVLVAKYDYRRPINQVELFKGLISLFYEKKQINNFIIVNYFKLYCGSDLIKNAFYDEHMELMTDLKKYFANKKEIIITDTYGQTIAELKPVLQNSWCYFSPYGSMQHIVDMLCDCKIKFCHGNKQVENYKFKILEIPKEFTKEEVPVTEKIKEITKRAHEKNYVIDVPKTLFFLNNYFDLL